MCVAWEGIPVEISNEIHRRITEEIKGKFSKTFLGSFFGGISTGISERIHEEIRGGISQALHGRFLKTIARKVLCRIQRWNFLRNPLRKFSNDF